MNAGNDYAIVMTTVMGEPSADALALKILSEKLAACVQVQAIRSYCKRKGETLAEPECLLLIKTRAALYAEWERFIRANHAQEPPEIIRIPVSGGSADSLRWIDEATAK